MTAAITRAQSAPSKSIDWARVMRAAKAFNIETFRPGQQALIQAVLENRDALGILPTGGGKSLCYQLPALLLPKPTVIVTPLLALVQDQVDHLDRWKLESSRLDSSLTTREERHNEREIETGISPLIYVTPERLQTEDCLALLRLNGVSRLVIDEAHCISDWGHDFRPAYLAIAAAAERLGRPPILAVIGEARQVISSIRAVAKYVARTKPALAEDLAVVAASPQRRSVAAVLLALETHARLMREHAELGPLTPAATMRRADELAEALRSHDAAVREEQVASASVTSVYASTLKELDALVRDTRALARVLFRDEPEIAQTFAPSRARRRSTGHRAQALAPI